MPPPPRHQPDRGGSQKLDNACDGNGKRDPKRDLIALDRFVRQKQQRQQHGQVKQDGCDSNDGDAAFGAESGRDHRNEPRKQDIGCGKKQQERRKRLLRVIETRCDAGNDIASEKHGEQGNAARHAEHHEQDAPRETVGIGCAIRAAVQLRPDRHEGAIERALRQQAAKKIDHLENGKQRL